MENKIKEIILDVAEEREIKLDDITIKPSTKLRDDLGLDSLGLALLTVHIEDEFGVDVFEEGLITTVGEIYKKLKENNGN